MSENNSEDNINDSSITPGSPVRLTVGLLTTILLGFAYFLYARDDYYYEKK